MPSGRDSHHGVAAVVPPGVAALAVVAVLLGLRRRSANCRRPSRRRRAGVGLKGRHHDIAWLTAAGSIVACAALAFGPHDFPQAGVFLGDAASYFLGGFLACTAVGALGAGLPPEAVLAPRAISLADTGVTLVRPVRRDDRWYEAHREHAYQRLTSCLAGSHTRAMFPVMVVVAACAVLRTLGLFGTAARLVEDVGIVALLAAYVCAPSLLEAASGGNAGPLPM